MNPKLGAALIAVIVFFVMLFGIPALFHSSPPRISPVDRCATALVADTGFSGKPYALALKDPQCNGLTYDQRLRAISTAAAK